MLCNHLERIAVLVPEPALSKLRKVGIWIEVDHPLTDVVPGPYYGSPQALKRKVTTCAWATACISREPVLFWIAGKCSSTPWGSFTS